ncbi:CBS domain-containing protein [Streptomyces nodosus]|uniref:CBS domain-containing protein n=1 Tax=Streptomyces nodosus TaxID=40318 RepID=UPI003820DBDF
MTPIQTGYGKPHPAPVTLVDDIKACGPRVCDDMTVEVALAVMASAHAEYLTVCDGDDQRTDLVTRVRLTALRDSPMYTDRIRLRDILAGTLPSPGALALSP